jgi:hypothetical protein
MVLLWEIILISQFPLRSAEAIHLQVKRVSLLQGMVGGSILLVQEFCFV